MMKKKSIEIDKSIHKYVENKNVPFKSVRDADLKFKDLLL